MDSQQITIHQLKNYLGTGLYCLLDYGEESYFDELVGIHKDGDLRFSEDQGDTHTIDSVKPECYRLSDFDKFIPELGFVPLEKIGYNKVIPIPILMDDLQKRPKLLPFWLFEKLFEWHFWPFGDIFFDEGLIIDKLKNNIK